MLDNFKVQKDGVGKHQKDYDIKNDFLNNFRHIYCPRYPNENKHLVAFSVSLFPHINSHQIVL